MPLSAIYPPGLGACIAQLMIWMRTSAEVGHLVHFAQQLAEGLPTAEQALEFARAKMREHKWNDQDPGWPNIDSYLCPPPDRREVKAALRRNKLLRQSMKTPVEISSGSDSEKIRRTTSSPAPSYLARSKTFRNLSMAALQLYFMIEDGGGNSYTLHSQLQVYDYAQHGGYSMLETCPGNTPYSTNSISPHEASPRTTTTRRITSCRTLCRIHLPMEATGTCRASNP